MALAMAGERQLGCGMSAVKVADLHRHPLLYGNFSPTQGEGDPAVPNFVWTPFNGGTVWQYDADGYWGVSPGAPPGPFLYNRRW